MGVIRNMGGQSQEQSDGTDSWYRRFIQRREKVSLKRKRSRVYIVPVNIEGINVHNESDMFDRRVLKKVHYYCYSSSRSLPYFHDPQHHPG